MDDLKLKKVAGLIRDRLNKNKNVLIAIVGETGSGKSWSALSLAERVDEDFSIEQVSVGDPERFIEILDNVRNKDAVIFDEAGVGMPSREWQSLQNRVLGYILQTFRVMNLCVIFTMPHISFIDKQARKLFHYTAIAQGYNIEHGYTICNFHKVIVHPYYDQLRYDELGLFANGKKVNINPVFVPKPSEELVAEYEKMALEFKTELRRRAKDQIQLSKNGSRETEIKLLIKELYNRGMKQVEIAKLLGKSRSWVFNVIHS